MMDKKYKNLFITTIILVCIVGIISVVGLWFVSMIGEIDWPLKISTITAILSATGGIISAILITANFIHSKYIYIEAQRPSLLIQIENFEGRDNNGNIIEKYAIIHYINISNYPFNNLKINVSVHCNNKIIKLDDVFKNKIILLGRDARQYKFDIRNELKKKGIEINDLLKQGNLILDMSYDYEFNNEKSNETVVQKYIYINEIWSIY